MVRQTSLSLVAWNPAGVEAAPKPLKLVVIADCAAKADSAETDNSAHFVQVGPETAETVAGPAEPQAVLLRD